MPALNPFLIASLARSVYRLTELGSLSLAIEELNRTYTNQFSFSETNLLKGKTGGPGIIKCQTAFGFTLIGEGALDGHYFMLLRGTNYLADWLTNLNITVSRSTSGQPVHDGFNAAFKSMQPKLTEFMNALPKTKPVTIHCVGHSLGGALATVCAEWVVNSYGMHPYLYTFGSPRVGMVGFADTCTKRVGNSNIFRAYHKTDIVPFIPVWPFIHTPYRSQDYYIPSPGNYPSAEYHSMVHYIESVKGKSWQVLGGLKPEQKSDEGIANWLKQNTPLSMTITNIEWLNHALIYVLKKCVQGAEWLISDAFTSSFTLMDKLAYILSKGVNLAETISSWVVYLIHKIMRILGYGRMVDAAEMTRDFIQTILVQLQQRLNQYAKAALSQALVKGNAI
jgi:triacylglycerol lipase